MELLGITEKILQQYHDNQEMYRNLTHDINDILTRIVSKNNFRISNMAIRIKSEEALKRKIEIKNKYQDIKDVTDVVACRVILLFENDIDRFYKCVKENFDVSEYNDKRKKSYDDRIDFGYNSLHLLIKFTDERCKMIEYSDYKNLVFELQIRTVLQHSWAEIEHGLGYKSQYEIPRDIRRRLTRLSATLELVDEEFVNISKAVDEYNKGLVHTEKVLKTDININSLIKYLYSSNDLLDIIHSAKNEYGLTIEDDTSVMTQKKQIHRMHYMGYTYIHELDEFVNNNIKSIRWLAHQQLSQYERGDHFNSYFIMVWISIVMLMDQGINDPENIFNDEVLESIKKFGESIVNGDVKIIINKSKEDNQLYE